MRIRYTLTLHIGLGLFLAALNCGCAETDTSASVDENCFDKVFNQTIDRVIEWRTRGCEFEEHGGEIEDTAWWFRPYYHKLVAMDDQYLPLRIMRCHGHPYATQQLELLLETTEGQDLKNTAAALYLFSYGLHPKAHSVLRGMDGGFHTLSIMRQAMRYPRQYEEARQQAGVPRDEWEQLSRSEKWMKLKRAWAPDNGPVEMFDNNGPAAVRPEPEPLREFNSELALSVRARLPDGTEERVGITPADQPLEIPECSWWAVKPLTGTTAADLAREVASKSIPGVFLENDPDAFLAMQEHLGELQVLQLRGEEATDETMAHLGALTNLRVLFLHSTEVTDAGLVHLEGLTNLQSLSIGESNVTDEGLAHLDGLTNLRELRLWNMQVTDAGLVHLKGLTNLRVLYLPGTKVTGAGLAHLRGLTELRELVLWNTQVADAGLVHLKGLTNLQELHLGETRVTDVGLAHLAGLTDLRGLSLWNTQVTDEGLAHLKGLTNLRELGIQQTQVTDAALRDLIESLPELIIHR